MEIQILWWPPVWVFIVSVKVFRLVSHSWEERPQLQVFCLCRKRFCMSQSCWKDLKHEQFWHFIWSQMHLRSRWCSSSYLVSERDHAFIIHPTCSVILSWFFSPVTHDSLLSQLTLQGLRVTKMWGLLLMYLISPKYSQIHWVFFRSPCTSFQIKIEVKKKESLLFCYKAWLEGWFPAGPSLQMTFSICYSDF